MSSSPQATPIPLCVPWMTGTEEISARMREDQLGVRRRAVRHPLRNGVADLSGHGHAVKRSTVPPPSSFVLARA
jgi:hypothetical protein